MAVFYGQFLLVTTIGGMVTGIVLGPVVNAITGSIPPELTLFR